MQIGLLQDVMNKVPKIRSIYEHMQYQKAIRDVNKPFNSNSIVAYAKGRMFDSSMTSGRSNGYSNNDLIENVAYIIESLIRHEVLSEIDLICENLPVYSGYSAFSFNDTSGYLASNVNDYYNGAYLINLTANWCAPILDYIGSSRTVLVADTYVGTESDKYKVYNIKGDVIDTTSFDFVGNTTNGIKKDWKFAKSIKDTDTFQLVQKLCEESFTSLIKSYNKYKLVNVLESKTTPDGTFNSPIIHNDMPAMEVRYTPLENLYSEYEIIYGYEYGREEYQGKILVNSTFATTIVAYGGYNFSAEQAKIKDCVTNYKIGNRKMSYTCDWIYDEWTASLFARKKIDLHTKQRAIVSYTGEFSTHVQYEEGDVVLINYDKIMPASLNNSAQFQIQSKSIDMSKNRIITFTLLEI